MAGPWQLDALRRVLGSRPPRLLEATAGRAAVALVFAGAPEDLELCLIERAVRPGDRWSGQMAFPGGRAGGGDGSPRAVAEREAREEVGLALDGAEYLGPLDELFIRHSGRVTRDVLSPFAYYAGESLPPLEAQAGEVAAALWLPVREIWDPANRTVFDWSREGRPVRLPGVTCRGKLIWGLTYMMLTSLGDTLGAPLPDEPYRLGT